MKTHSSLSRLGAVLAGALLLARAVQAAEVEPGFTSLFNGTDLTGWEGEPTLWSVQNGAITGRFPGVGCAVRSRVVMSSVGHPPNAISPLLLAHSVLYVVP